MITKRVFLICILCPGKFTLYYISFRPKRLNRSMPLLKHIGYIIAAIIDSRYIILTLLCFIFSTLKPFFLLLHIIVFLENGKGCIISKNIYSINVGLNICSIKMMKLPQMMCIFICNIICKMISLGPQCIVTCIHV